MRRRLEHLGEDRAAAGEAELWRRRGELLQIHRAALHPGQAEVTVPDVFADGQPPVTIPLDPRADPAENIERCFRRYRKRRDAGPHVDERVAQTERAIAEAETLRERLEAADSPAAVAELAGALPGASRALRAQVRGESTPAAAAAGGQAAGPLRRRSADGYEILVGRSGAENDRVTFRLGRGRDWWLHAQGIPGSHVLVVNPAGGALPPRTLREAAWLAGHYSRARASGHAEVDYTQRKHVRRQKGGDPGQVTYTQNKTLRVALDDPELAQVLERTVDEAS